MPCSKTFPRFVCKAKQFPSVSIAPVSAIRKARDFRKLSGSSSSPVFSHRRWRAVVVSGRAADPTRPLPPGGRWVAEEELDFLALPKVYEKALSIIKDPVQLELSLET